MKVYVAGPYGKSIGNSTEQCEANVQLAIKASQRLILLGHSPFCPHLYHYIDKGWAESPGEDTWLKICMTWVPFCDAVLRLPGKSHGADAEVNQAKNMGIPVVHSFEELGKL